VAGLGGVFIMTDGKTLCVNGQDGAVGLDTVSASRKYVLPWSFPNELVSRGGRTGAAVQWAFAPVSDDASTPVTFWNFDDGRQQRQVDVPYGRERPIGILADSQYFVCSAGPDRRRMYLINVKEGKIQTTHLANASVQRLFLLDSGEIAVVGTEGTDVVIGKIKLPSDKKETPSRGKDK
jgi:hypothetical protein